MLSEEQLRAILSYQIAHNSTSDYDRVIAEGDCWHLGMLDEQNNLKPEYLDAMNQLMRHVQSGLPIATALDKVKNEFQAPPKSYADMLQSLRT